MFGPLIRIFPVFVIAMWVTAGVWIAKGEWSGLNTLMLVTAAVIIAIVFVDFVSVFSFGYALCMVALPIVILAVRGITTAGLLVCGRSVLYGLRLLAFIVQRRRSVSYAPSRARERTRHTMVPAPIKVLMFVMVTTLMTFEAMSPYVVASDGTTSPVLYIGVALMVVGLVLETVADEQKYRAKERDVSAFVRGGLFARTRHPNYTGEILFQIGLAVAAFGAVSGWWQVLAVVVAPAYMVVLMALQAKIGSARLESTYAADPAWPSYRASSGLLLPSLGHARVPD